ncbi:uncharacterized protein LOC121370738 [Gigantopelta aegis]|uniref:uncharacterized protein LOC121370738 n=1 Tax=Gigantopelta aegis TaxID=1735272 RepID=UPI001B88DA6C|nr:uncharacterized protein LOC121370738 [Gigantopelta aegis]
MKLFVLLLIFTCVALQQSDALRWGGRWKRWFRRPFPRPFPGPIGIRPFPGPIGILPMNKGRDVATEPETDEDESLDDTELEKLFSERDIQDLIENLELDDDDLRSLEELNDEQ